MSFTSQAMPAKSVWLQPAQNLLVLRSPNLIFTLRQWLWICADNMHPFYLQMKGQRHHLSQNIVPAVAGLPDLFR